MHPIADCREFCEPLAMRKAGRLPSLAAAALAGALLAVGCGSEAGSPSPSSEPGSTRSQQATGSTDSAGSSTRSSTEATTTGQSEPNQVYFSSPSRNIWCSLGDGGARCDVAERDWSVPKPESCDFDYGYGAEVVENDVPAVVEGGREIIPAVSAGKGSLLCGSDSLIGNGRPLAYGMSRRASPNGTVVCESREDGITCRNGKGHGFTVSKQRYRLF